MQDYDSTPASEPEYRYIIPDWDDDDNSNPYLLAAAVQTDANYTYEVTE